MIGTRDKAIKYLLEQDTSKQYEVKEYKPKRSLNANNYYWELVNELANALRMGKEETHLFLLKEYGQSEMVSVVSDIDVKPYFRYFAEAGESVLNGKRFKHYKVYKGSSEMNSKEMSILINGLVEECKAQGIETKSKAEINSLIGGWK